MEDFPKAPGVLDFLKDRAVDVAKDEARKRAPNGKGDIAVSAVSLLTGGVANIGTNAKGLLGPVIDFGIGKGFDKLKGSKNGAKIFKYASKLLGGRGEKSNPIGDLQKMYARADPQLTFEFEVEMPDALPFYDSAGFAAVPDEYIEDIDLPTDNIESGSEVFVNARKISLPGKISCSEFDIKFYAERRHYVLRYLEAWKASVVTPLGIYNLPYSKDGDGYMKTVKCHLKASGTRVLTVELYGCFPTSRPAINMQSATSDRLIISQSFNCNGARLVFDPPNTPTGSGEAPQSVGSLIKSQVFKAVKRRL